MKFKTITMENFLVYGEEQKVDLDNQGLVLIQGVNQDANGFESNGAGKSTLLHGIIYALYGKLPDGTGGDDVINKEVKKNMKVTLTFELDNAIYRVERYRKHKTNKNKTLLFREIQGEDKETSITQSSVKKTNELVQKLVQMSMETFLNSIIFGLGNKIKFTEATDKEKKQLLEDIANISIYKRAYELTKEDLKKSEQDATSLLSKRELLETKLQGFNAVKEEARKANETKKQQLNYLKQTYDESIANYKRLKLEVEQTPTGTEEADYNELLMNVQKKLDKLSTVGTEAIVRAATLNSNQQVLKNTLINSSKELTRLKESLVRLSKSPNPVCEYCGSILDDEHKKKELTRLVNDYKKTDASLQEGKNSYLSNQDELKALEPRIAEEQAVQGKYKELHREQLLNTRKRQDLEFKLSNLENAKQQVIRDKNNLDALDSGQEQVTDVSQDIKDCQKEIDSVEKEIQDNKEKTSNLEKVVKIYSDKGVISQVLDLVMPYINQQANYYLSELTDNTITININPQSEAKNGNVSERLNIEVTNINGGDEYGLNSKGEKKRIDLAISLALQDYVMSKSVTKTNLIGYDEVFDGLDNIGIQRIMNVLQRRVKSIPSVFVISHNDMLKELFEKTITITKQEGQSHIEQ